MKKLLAILILIMLVTDAFADIIFILDRRAANRNGHIAVLVGNEKSGWRYVSINGTGTGAKPWGISVNQDIGTLIVDADSNLVTEMRSAIRMANTINPEERHHYDFFRRVECGDDEDFNVLISAKSIANADIYGIFGPGQSCIDVAQAAFASLYRTRIGSNSASVPGATDWVPRRWFDKLDKRIRQANSHIGERFAHIRFYHPFNKKNRTFKLRLPSDINIAEKSKVKIKIPTRLVHKEKGHLAETSQKRGMFLLKKD